MNKLIQRNESEPAEQKKTHIKMTHSTHEKLQSFNSCTHCYQGFVDILSLNQITLRLIEREIEEFGWFPIILWNFITLHVKVNTYHFWGVYLYRMVSV